METDYDKLMYDAINQVLHGEKDGSVGKAFREKLDLLQGVPHTFPEEQWRVISQYLYALDRVYTSAFRVAMERLIPKEED